MTLLTIIAITTCFIVYFLIEGVREAYYYHKYSKSTAPRENLHPLFFIQRAEVFGIALLLEPTLSFGLILLSFIFMFSFIHDGAYYSTREYLNPGVYPDKFLSNSKTSNAFIELNHKWRVFLFAMGILLYTTALIYFR